jgi:hypothetical protein
LFTVLYWTTWILLADNSCLEVTNWDKTGCIGLRLDEKFIWLVASDNHSSSHASACNKQVVYDVCVSLTSLMELPGIAQKPQNTFTAYKTGFQTDASSQKILCRHGMKRHEKSTQNHSCIDKDNSPGRLHSNCIVSFTICCVQGTSFVQNLVPVSPWQCQRRLFTIRLDGKPTVC